MTLMELVNRILSIQPNANFSAWDCPIEKYQGEQITPLSLSGYFVCWNTTNVMACPNQVAINAVVLQVI